MAAGFSTSMNPALGGLQRQTYGYRGYPSGAPDLSRGGQQPGLTPPPISQGPGSVAAPPAQGLATSPGVENQYGLPGYVGTVPLTTNVDPTTQYEAVSRLAGGEQANQAARELQRQRDEAEGLRQNRALGSAEKISTGEIAGAAGRTAAEQAGASGRTAAEQAGATGRTTAEQEGATGRTTAEVAGRASLSAQQAAEELFKQKYGAGLQGEAEARRAKMLLEIMASLTGGAPQVEYGAGFGGPDRAGYEAARQAAFARAKDQTGQIGRSALDALRGQMASSNLLGSGRETQGIQDIVSGGQGQLGEVTREQQIQDLLNLQNIANKTYEGRIAQRGQNLALAPSLAGLITSRALY